MKTKIFTFFLAIMASVGTMFASSVTINGITYDLNEGDLTAVVSSARGLSGRIVIPSIVTYNKNNYTVTSIRWDAFTSCLSLTSIEIPNSVTSIGMGAFFSCSNLTSVTWNAINCADFSGTSPFCNINMSVKSFIFGQEVEHIPAHLCAALTNLTSIEIPNSVTSIGDYAFSGCTGLTSVKIPNNVTSIGDYAFNGCTGLTSVIIGNSVTSIGDYAFSDCSSLTSVTIPNSVTSIGRYTFNNCSNLVSITIGSGLTSINNGTFRGCSALTSVTINSNALVSKNYTASSSLNNIFGSQVIEYIIGNSITSIGNYAFANCTDITSITIPKSITSIGEYAFNSCTSLTAVIWNAKNCADFAFTSSPFYNINSQITSFTFGEEVEHIPAYLCEGMRNLTSITIPKSVTEIGSLSFHNCTGITSVEWNAKNCADFGASSYAPFYSNSSQINSFTLGNEVEHIPANLCIYMENLSSINLPNSIKSIGDWAFNGCKKLASVTIPTKVETIGEYAFYNCDQLSTVTVNSNAVVSKNYSSSSSLSSIFGRQVTKYTIGSGVTSIGKYAFQDCADMTSISIPNGVTSIGENAFNNCNSLTSVTIPSGVKSIGQYTFYGCYSLSSISIPNGITSIGNNAFENCRSLISITIPTGVTSVGQYAFNNCTGLASVKWDAIHCSDFLSTSAPFSFSQISSFTIGNQVEYIPAYLCYGMSNLHAITIPNSVTSIGNYAFSSCGGITSVTIPVNVTSIGTGAFYGCSYLTSIEWNAKNCADFAASSSAPFCNISSQITSFTLGDEVTYIPAYLCEGMSNLVYVSIPNSVTNIGKRAFYNCNSLSSITIPNNVKTIGNMAFYGCNNIRSLTIPNSVTSIGNNAFALCERLTSITVKAETPPALQADAFNATNDCPIYVPCGSIEAYQSAWSQYADRIQGKNCFTTYYTVTFKDWDGTVLKTEQVEKGKSATAPANPTRQGYTFTGWDKDFSNVQSNLTVTAQYTQNSSSTTYYTVRFRDWDGTILKTEQVEKGKSATAPANPTRQGYTFTGWDKDFSNVQSNLIVTAQYTQNSSSTTYYTVRFRDWDGTTLKTEQVEKGHAATPPANPTREGYTFTGWNKDFSNVQSNLIVTAQYTRNSSSTTYYTVTFKDWDGTTLKTEQVEKGKSATAPANPTRQGYTFTGWDKDFSNVQSNLTVTAQYTQNSSSTTYYGVRFRDWDGTILKTEQVEKGKSATAPANPTRQGYTFTGWDKDFSNVQSNLIVTAQYTRNSSSTTYYTVTFKDWDGIILKIEEVEKGHDAIGPEEEPSREGYTFIGWSEPITNIQNNLIVIAEYKLGDGIEDILVEDAENITKIIDNGKILILRGGKTFTISGQEVR